MLTHFLWIENDQRHLDSPTTYRKIAQATGWSKSRVERFFVKMGYRISRAGKILKRDGGQVENGTKKSSLSGTTNRIKNKRIQCQSGTSQKASHGTKKAGSTELKNGKNLSIPINKNEEQKNETIYFGANCKGNQAQRASAGIELAEVATSDPHFTRFWSVFVRLGKNEGKPAAYLAWQEVAKKFPEDDICWAAEQYEEKCRQEKKTAKWMHLPANWLSKLIFLQFFEQKEHESAENHQEQGPIARAEFNEFEALIINHAKAVLGGEENVDLLSWISFQAPGLSKKLRKGDILENRDFLEFYGYQIEEEPELRVYLPSDEEVRGNV